MLINGLLSNLIDLSVLCWRVYPRVFCDCFALRYTFFFECGLEPFFDFGLSFLSFDLDADFFLLLDRVFFAKLSLPTLYDLCCARLFTSDRMFYFLILFITGISSFLLDEMTCQLYRALKDSDSLLCDIGLFWPSPAEVLP